LLLLLVVALTIVRLRNIFAVVMLSGIYSFLMATTFLVLDAVDVAFTEAAVGAGITTVLGLAAMALTTDREKIPTHWPTLPLAVVVVTGAILLYAVPDMPRFGAADSPIHRHVVPRYIDETPRAIGIPNIVTSVLADYRGYDTLGEVTVIFTAGVGVLLLLGRTRRRPKGSTK
jgi:multicomponent Na+:H+ antiporter subunit B|tara:strand:+ start:277 stop:795 length:519 start_codon:yes stop_codon:yes gene_type:complete